jgi:hypothetical protein
MGVRGGPQALTHLIFLSYDYYFYIANLASPIQKSDLLRCEQDDHEG